MGGVDKVSTRNLLMVYMFTVFVLYSRHAITGATS